MTLKINKIRYSSRHGISVDFEKPGTFVLSSEEVFLLLMYLKGHLTRDEVAKEFKADEQAVILRYYQACQDKMVEIGKQYADSTRKRSATKELKQLLNHGVFWLFKDARCFLERYLGWHIPN